MLLKLNRLATSSVKLGLFGVACRIADGYGLVIPLSIVKVGKETFGSEEAFNWWIRMLQGFLDLLEQVHIYEKQVASIFCETMESNTGAEARMVNVGLFAGLRASVGKISAKCFSFSAVSAPIFARKYAFCSIFSKSTRFSS